MANLNLQTKVKVSNRSDGSVGYKLDALHIKRHWRHPGDYINIPIEELLELKSSRGTKYILDHLLKIEDNAARALVFDEAPLPPEYDYSEAEVEQLLYAGTNEQLYDALDYAPDGVLSIIRTKACQKLPDTMAKIEAINKKFNISLVTIYQNGVLAKQEDSAEEEKAPVERRTAPIEVPKKTTTRKTTPKV